MSKLSTLDLFYLWEVYTMASRLELQAKLEEILGSRNVYFQPPESLKMSYPAIRYVRVPIRNEFADDSVYMQYQRYELTLIDHDPDSEFVSVLSKLPTCRHDRHYHSSGLNHDVFTIYY